MPKKFLSLLVAQGPLWTLLLWALPSVACAEQSATTRPVRAYYLDSEQGGDGNAGTEAAPWKTLKNLAGRTFNPGDGIYFARGSHFTGGFVISSSGSADEPITVTAYGTGPVPKFTNPDYAVLNGNAIRVDGSYVVIDGLYFSDGATGPAGRASQSVGAIFLSKGATHDVVRNCEITRWPMPVHVYGQYNLITHNHIHDLMNLPERGWWAVGIMICNSNNRVSYNHITNCRQLNDQLGYDGGAIELDDRDLPKDNVMIDHNLSSDNQGFLEIVEGSASVKNLVVAYNVSNDYQQFLRLSSTEIENARVENNTVIFGRQSILIPAVFDCSWFCAYGNRNTGQLVPGFIGTGSPFGTMNPTSVLTYRNNIFYLGRNFMVSPYCNFPHDHNVYYRPRDRAIRGWALLGANAELGPGDQVADPKFVNLDGGDFHLQPDSPALHASVNLGYTEDLDGKPVPAASPDAGAFQHQ